MVNTVNPNANATPTKPIPSCGKAAASTADPHPPSTSQAVPMNSAASFLSINRLQCERDPRNRRPSAAARNRGGTLGLEGKPDSVGQFDHVDRRGGVDLDHRAER